MMVETQLRKLHKPDVMRTYSIFHFKYGVCELNLRHDC